MPDPRSMPHAQTNDPVFLRLEESNELLAARIAARDMEAFGLVYDRFAHQVFAMGGHMLGVPAASNAAPPNWVKWHDPAAEASELFSKTNGTGPYKLGSWKPGEGFELVANESFWLKEPAWEGGAAGVAKIPRIVIKEIDEWGTRFAALQAGDADYVTINPEFWPQVDELSKQDCDAATGARKASTGTGDIVRYRGLAQTSATDVLLNANINTEGGHNYIGSGAVDGNGVPADFFNDAHIRSSPRMAPMAQVCRKNCNPK